MAKPKASTGGIAALYRMEAINHIVFGAIHQARQDNPARSIAEITESVIKVFGIKDTNAHTLQMIYYRAEKAFLSNGGINE